MKSQANAILYSVLNTGADLATDLPSNSGHAAPFQFFTGYAGADPAFRANTTRALAGAFRRARNRLAD